MGTVYKLFKFDIYDPTTSWETYISRFELVCRNRNYMGNEDEAERFRVGLLLEVVGSSVYERVDSYFNHNAVSQSYNDVKAALNRLYGKAEHWCSARIHFRCSQRLADETIAAYVSRLKSLATHCEFGTSLDEQLRDQFIAGINDKELQRLLVQFPDHARATLDNYVRHASAKEIAAQTVQAMHVSTPINVAKVSNRSSKQKSYAPRAKTTSSEKQQWPSQTSQPQKLTTGKDCLNCGGKWHNKRSDCPARNATCNACKKIGHYQKVCRSCAPPHAVVTSNTIRAGTNDSQTECDESHFFTIRSEGDRMVINVALNGVPVAMDFDTCASKSIIGRMLWTRIGAPQLSETTTLRGYTNFKIKPLGQTTVTVSTKGQSKALTVVVVDADDVPLFGHPWIKAFNINIDGVRIESISNNVKPQPSLLPPSDDQPLELNQLLSEFSGVFSGKLGKVKGHKAIIHILDTATPKVCKARRVPFALLQNVENELARLEKEGILQRVDANTPVTWASPTVNVVKKQTGCVRICGDYKVTINPFMITDHYQLPTFEEIAAKHMKNLRRVLQLLLDAGITTQLIKCHFLQPMVTHMAHRIDKYDIHPTSDKVEAICNRPKPINVSQLRSLLGQINYYARFIPGLQGKCAPLHRLLQKGVKWEWTTNDSQIVSELNSKLSSNDTLVHFDVNKPLVLSCDACEYGIGAELAHSFPDGTLRPIAFASRTLSNAEKNYSSIDREALALVFGVLKFHQYLYGRKFILYTDHKPLQYIFRPTADISRTAANRLQRWAVSISNFKFYNFLPIICFIHFVYLLVQSVYQ